MSSNNTAEAAKAESTGKSDPPNAANDTMPPAMSEKTSSSASTASSNATDESKEEEEEVGDTQRSKIFNSKEFLNFLTTQVDIANLMVETKDGERFKASFPGSSVIPSTAAATGDGPPKSVFKSLEMLKDLGMVDSDTVADPTFLQSTVSLEYFPPNPYPASRSNSAALAAANGSNGGSKPPSADAFASREWASEYQNSHVEVPYTNCFDPKAGESTGNGTASLPPKKRAAPNGSGDDHWNDMFKRALAPLVDAVSVAQRQHQAPSNGSDTTGSGGKSTNPKKRPSRRKPRKIIPEVKTFCEFTEKDVLFGRGGRSNHHPGNKAYRDIVTKHQHHYKGCDKNEKTKVAQGIVDHMQKEVGARFLELDKDTDRWYLVPNVVARRKVGQALRENNTDEARAAKRAKYQGRYSNAATKKAAEVNAAAAANMAATKTKPSVSANNQVPMSV